MAQLAAGLWHWCLPSCIYIKNSIASVHSFFEFFLPGVDKSMEGSTIPACPSLVCFYNTGNTEETNSSKVLCLMFVYVCFVFV